MPIPQGIAVKEGSPLNYAKGERFVVMYRKTFEKTFPYPRSLVEALTIFIYDEEGGLLLKKMLGSDDASSGSFLNNYKCFG